jgi:DNA-binding transcriptional LysR family regulator
MPETRRYFKEIRFRQLRAMVELAREGSFTAVALSLKRSVPSIWQQVRALEDELGVALVQANGQSVALTPQGQLLVRLATPLVEDFDAICRIFKEQANTLPRRLRVATTASLLAHELTEPLQRYRESCPDVELSFIDRPSAISLQHLLQGEADVAIVGRINSSPDDDKLSITSLAQYPFVMVAPEGHPLLKRPRINVRDLVKEKLIMPAGGTNSRERIESVFSKHGLLDKLHVVLDASHFELIIGYVRLQFGIALTSLSPETLNQVKQKGSQFAGLEIRDLTGIFGTEEIVLIRRPARFEQEHQRVFCEIVMKISQNKK